MGFFESVVGGALQTGYNVVVKPVVTTAQAISSGAQAISRPIVPGTVSTGQTEQVAVQPRPPIVTAVAPSQAAATAYQQAAATQGRQVTTTPQVTPSGRTVYVTSRASPAIPEPVIISRPVQIQAPSAAQIVGSLAPGGALLGGLQIISGDKDVLQNIAMDLPATGTFVSGSPTLRGYRETQVIAQAAAAEQRGRDIQARSEAAQERWLQQKAQTEQQVLGFEQKKQVVIGRKERFESLGPATSLEEYNTRLGEYNLLTQDIQALNIEGERIKSESVASNQAMMREYIGLRGKQEQLRAQGVDIEVAAENLGTTGLSGLTTGFDEMVNKPISDYALTQIGKPFGVSKEDVAYGLKLNRMISETQFNVAPSIQTMGTAFGSGFVEDTLTKPGEAILWTGVGLATGGVARAIGPSIGPAIAAARAPGASLGAKAAGFGIRAAPVLMGGLFAGSVGVETAFETTPTGMKVRTPGGMVSRLGGLTATEILPMVGGAYVGYKAPEIGQSIVRNIRGASTRLGMGEWGEIGGELRSIPSGFRPTGELRQIGTELRSIPFREPTFRPTGTMERPIGGKQPRIERISEPTQEEFLQLNYQVFEQAGVEFKPATGLTREQLLPVPVETRLEFVDLTKPTRGVPISSKRLTPVYEVQTGKPGRYAYRGMQAKINPLEGDPLGIIYEDIPSSGVFEYNARTGKWTQPVTSRVWSKTVTEWGLPKADIFMQPAVEPVGTGRVFGPQRPTRTPVTKQIDTFLGRPSEQMKAFDSFAGWKGAMETSLGGGGGRVKVGGGGLLLTERPTTVAESTRVVGTYPRVSTEGTVGIGIPSFSQTEKNIMAAAGSMAFWEGTGSRREMGFRPSGTDAYGQFRRQIEFEKFYDIGVYPTTSGKHSAAADSRRFIDPLAQIGSSRTQPLNYRDIGDYTGLDIEIEPRKQGPIVRPSRMLGPVDIIGETNIPDLDMRVRPIQIAPPDLLIQPDVRITQVPGTDMSFLQLQQQLLITELETPPYAPPTYEIPPFEIPPIVIPGFPMLPGGGGGGGGYGMGQWGYLFEETWAAGGDADPFGIGGMNFDAESMIGLPTRKRSKRRRR